MGSTQHTKGHLVFTKVAIEKIPLASEGERYIYRDTKVRGFCLRVTETRKTWYAEKKVGNAPVRFTIGTFPEMSVEEARGLAAAFLGDVARWKATGFNPESKPEQLKKPEPEVMGLTVAAAIDAYVARRRDEWNRPAAAEKQFRWWFTKHLSHLGDRALRSITPDECIALHEDIRKDHGPYSANRALEILSALFNKILRGEINPCKAVDMVSEKNRVRYLTGDELVRFWTALDADGNKDFSDFVRIAHGTGVRVGCIFAAEWRHIDWDAQVWRVPLTKNGDPLVVPLVPTVLNILRERFKKYAKEPWVFPSKRLAEAGHVTNFKREWREFLKRAEISDFRMHDLRHDLASAIVQSGRPLLQAGKVLGHRDAKSTSIYSHLDITQHRDALLDAEKFQKKQMAQAKRRQRRLTA